MPFPLAHPAAVLPLRRFCPRWLSFPALVVGAAVPDAAYFLKDLGLANFAHTLPGVPGFSLPAGAALLWIMYFGRRFLTQKLPRQWLRPLLSETWLAPPTLSVAAISIIIGATTHVCWDSFTHSNGWVVERVPLLDAPLGHFAGRTVRLCRVLWHVSSFGGVAALQIAYRNAEIRSRPSSPHWSAWKIWAEAFLIALLVIPIELVHELAPHRAGSVLVAVMSALLLGGALWRTRAIRAADGANPQPTA